MTSRFEARIDRQIREATERGDFADLPGAGKPLPDAGNDAPLAEDWWLSSYIQREKIGSGALPTTLRLRKELEDLPQTLAKERLEGRVRQIIDDLNAQIRSALLGPVDGPPVALRAVDVEATVRQWRAGRGLG